MKCTTPEISWHNRDPVLSIDIQNKSCETSVNEDFWRVATGGADSHVLIWHLLTCENSATIIKCVADLERHQKAVNVVRFSPSKEILASADDESVIILWKQKEECDFFISPEDNENKEQWCSWKVLKGHLEDVYDICWSPDSTSIISGSVDNTAILWDIHKGRSNGILSDSKGFVQGVSWDPCNQYICTISSDRQCRLVDVSTKKTVQRVHKSNIPTPVDYPLRGKTVRLFYDDTFKSFFRRLTFSIDGILIIVPSGIIEPQDTIEKISNATIVFSRHNLKEPIMVLPSLDECTIAIRCCPVYFELRKDGPIPTIALPYRIIFAVATQHSILIYDTQQISPIAVISNIHYTRLTDIAWSSNGRILVVSSTDGYCSIIHFSENELGHVYNGKGETSFPNSNNNERIASYTSSAIETKDNTLLLDIDTNAMDVDVTKNRKITTQSIDDQCEKYHENSDIIKQSNYNLSEGNLSKYGNKSDETIEETEDIKLVYNEESDNDTKSGKKNTSPKMTTSSIISKKTPRRVKLITLSSSKRKK
ncbi:chromatin assembly factor 1 subunit B isoform X1 [Vespula pensylvanica]|uniref:chromatin assembly factor 1 subunit B isoform X1 n=1 Tax=Vespula pensylvanica TaxID=30213 RepID=UPI001CB9D830|nr:chromatin assembly factor 1 subunit B isoform X1 [Vespula pensylvanica]